MEDPRSPRNTTKDIQGPAALAFLAEGMHSDGPGAAIERMEAQGQRELVNSEVIPSRVNYGSEAELTALGFELGERVDGDPMFRRAALPAGWRREGSEHSMWSYIVDELDRRRCSIFYKAAFYDRDAFISMVTVAGYVSDCLWKETPVLTDDAWATPAAVGEAIKQLRERETERIELYERIGKAADVDDSRARVARLDAMEAEVSS